MRGGARGPVKLACCMIPAKDWVMGQRTKGSPQYPQVAISGLSVLMKILG